MRRARTLTLGELDHINALKPPAKYRGWRWRSRGVRRPSRRRGYFVGQRYRVSFHRAAKEQNPDR